jgi:hypothetical protein
LHTALLFALAHALGKPSKKEDERMRAIQISSFGNPTEYDAEIAGILREATAMVAAGTLHFPIAATYPLSAFKEAVAHVGRGGKVLLD